MSGGEKAANIVWMAGVPAMNHEAVEWHRGSFGQLQNDFKDLVFRPTLFLRKRSFIAFRPDEFIAGLRRPFSPLRHDMPQLRLLAILQHIERPVRCLLDLADAVAEVYAFEFGGFLVVDLHADDAACT